VDHTEYAANKKILNEVFESDMVLTRDQMLDVIEDFKTRISKEHWIKRNPSMSRWNFT
jgi:hypothetical protein